MPPALPVVHKPRAAEAIRLSNLAAGSRKPNNFSIFTKRHARQIRLSRYFRFNCYRRFDRQTC